jgi:hypothetical protein
MIYHVADFLLAALVGYAAGRQFRHALNREWL